MTHAVLRSGTSPSCPFVRRRSGAGSFATTRVFAQRQASRMNHDRCAWNWFSVRVEHAADDEHPARRRRLWCVISIGRDRWHLPAWRTLRLIIRRRRGSRKAEQEQRECDELRVLDEHGL